VKTVTEKIPVKTNGNTDIIDITDDARTLLLKSGVNNGIVTFFVQGSTAGLTTVEYEPGLLKDLPLTFEKIAPANSRYFHDETWGDGNGHSHVRASLLGPSLTVPFTNGSMTLGTWQQIILIDFDNRSRRREIVMQIMGE
jgi:secondary thiamine-phosphate synthase enzyme